MSTFFRGSALPTRSPHLSNRRQQHSHPQQAPLSPAQLLALLKSKRLLALVLLCASGVLVVLHRQRARAEASREPVTLFPRHGVRESLWEQLELLGHQREVVFQPEEIEWDRETTQRTPVPWFKEALLDSLPRAALADKKSSTPTPAHTLDPFTYKVPVFPLRPVLAGTKNHPFVPFGHELVYGIVTTVKRAKMMSELWERWLLPQSDEDAREGDRSACLVLLSREESWDDVESLRSHFKLKGMECAVRQSNHERYEVRVLSMAREMRDYAKELGRTFKWYVYGDDDTFWLDQRTQRRMLGKYDPLSDWFIGASTEAQAQLEQFGRMAFGGAGIVVSDPLALKMDKVWDQCWEQYRHVFGGDEMLTRCAALAAGATKDTVMTEELGMHQFDIPGDTTGVLQGGIPFLNLHHYIGGFWVHIFGYGTYLSEFDQIRVIKKAAEFLGGDNMFRRLYFGDGRWLVTLGYSVTLFDKPITKSMTQKMEHTWYEGYRLGYADRDQLIERRDGDGKPVKQTFYLDDVQVINQHTAIFTYAMSDRWDEHLTSEERPRLTLKWDGCWDKRQAKECGGRGELPELDELEPGKAPPRRHAEGDDLLDEGAVEDLLEQRDRDEKAKDSLKP